MWFGILSHRPERKTGVIAPDCGVLLGCFPEKSGQRYESHSTLQRQQTNGPIDEQGDR
jgi:hypothetical protein